MLQKIKITEHPRYKTPIGFSIAFYSLTLIFYVIYGITYQVIWLGMGMLANAAGIMFTAMIILAALIDWIGGLSHAQVSRPGIFYVIYRNAIALALFGICFFQQKEKWYDIRPEINLAVSLSVAGLLFLLLTGFIAWAMNRKHHFHKGSQQKRLAH